MPSGRNEQQESKEMAEVGPYQQSASVDPAAVLQWSGEYADNTYDSQPWNFRDPHVSSAGADSQWSHSATSAAPDFVPFPHHSQSLQFANASELRQYEQQSRAAMSSINTPSPSAGFLPHFHELQDLSAEPTMLASSKTFPPARHSGMAYSPIAPELGQPQHARQPSQGRRSPSQTGQQRPAALRVPSHSHQASRGSRSNSMTSSIQLQDEDRLLLHLKEEKALSWKEIAQRFQTELGTSYQIPALQMRYKRLRERMRIWSEGDLAALRQAREFWEAKKWEIISNKMVEFGASEKFSAEACKRKLHELDNSGGGPGGGSTTPLEAAVGGSSQSPSGRLPGGTSPFGQQPSQGQPWMGGQW